TMHAHLADQQEFIDMFVDEARLAARIHHPNVVSILEIGHSDGTYFLVMDYVEGVTPAEMLSDGVKSGRRVPMPVTTRIVLEALAGLHAAHELLDADGKPLGLVHRDISPQNVLVGTDGLARLTDFGVARAAERISKTRTG